MPLQLEIDRQSAAEQVADALRAAILRGEAEPGSQLREAAIGAAAGVSRNTIREALRLLTRERLVTHSAFRGVTVRRLEEADVADIFRARLALELIGVEAAERSDAANLASLPQAAHAFAEAVEREDWDAAFEHDIALHARIVGMVGSERLDAAFVGLMRELRLGYLVHDGLATEALPADREEHACIAGLLVERDGAGAARIVRAHLARSEALLLGLMRDGSGA